MIRLGQELEDKLRNLDPIRARQLESAVRDVIARIDPNTPEVVAIDREKSLGQLIGVWKCENPPSNDHVRQMLDIAEADDGSFGR